MQTTLKRRMFISDALLILIALTFRGFKIF